jgi:diguanylate cyclase (GGDEF)-like protein
VADRASDDRRADFTNGAITGQRGTTDPAPEELDPDRALSARDQTLADADQTASDSAQAESDSAQAESDSAQAASDSDQAASDSDQAASRRDLARGGDPDGHKFTRELRARGTEQREETARERVEAAAARDAIARARDVAALARDRAAELHDRELAALDAASLDDGPARRAAANNRRIAAVARAAAAEVRARAAADREQAARDREQAARDRVQAQADREALLEQLAIAETDALTGARTRAAGLVDLDHEIDRARRTEGLLVAAYVDLVGLKAVNDTRGHSAGDALLRRAVSGIRDHLRPYDLIIRLGGDEFLCVMSGATIQEGRQRFATVQVALAAEPDPCEIKIGFAALAPADSAADLIERADAELPVSLVR